jgi:hypothetical protein
LIFFCLGAGLVFSRAFNLRFVFMGCQIMNLGSLSKSPGGNESRYFERMFISSRFMSTAQPMTWRD